MGALRALCWHSGHIISFHVSTKMQQQTLQIGKKQVILLLVCAAVVLCALCGGYGYFFGRYEQVLLNKSVLKAIPEVNCGGPRGGLVQT